MKTNYFEPSWIQRITDVYIRERIDDIICRVIEDSFGILHFLVRDIIQMQYITFNADAD